MTAMPLAVALSDGTWFYVYGPDMGTAAGANFGLPERHISTYFPHRETTHEPLPTEPWHPMTLPVPRATPPVRRTYRVQAR